jgi:hypothetical protein
VLERSDGLLPKVPEVSFCSYDAAISASMVPYDLKCTLGLWLLFAEDVDDFRAGFDGPP